MNKWYMIIMSAIVIFSLVFFRNVPSEAMGKSEIEEMAAGVTKQGAKIDGWSIYTREEMEIPDFAHFQQKVSVLKKIFPQFQWGITKDNEIWTAFATHYQKDLNLQEKIQLISTYTNASKVSYLLYEVKGNGWKNRKWAEISRTLERRNGKLFQKNTIKFTCINAHFNDKMNSVLLRKANDILKEFHAKQVEKLSEETFVSVSAYTDEWRSVLPAKDGKKMNLQIAIRNSDLGGKTTLVVGTPIITTEY